MESYRQRCPDKSYCDKNDKGEDDNDDNDDYESDGSNTARSPSDVFVEQIACEQTDEGWIDSRQPAVSRSSMQIGVTWHQIESDTIPSDIAERWITRYKRIR